MHSQLLVITTPLVLWGHLFLSIAKCICTMGPIPRLSFVRRVKKNVFLNSLFYTAFPHLFESNSSYVYMYNMIIYIIHVTKNHHLDAASFNPITLLTSNFIMTTMTLFFI
ncbi:hypothetical protein EGW08_009418 [Elysia chlorotica]|uniref:Uncharacterized protein n=1 Tax=Elysia chlorotica TaxID=188477 RepID=A0A433TML7_ELYCH|nr:hypothetical protein EGW08_009418 [Elysia chlorotica]